MNSDYDDYSFNKTYTSVKNEKSNHSETSGHSASGGKPMNEENRVAKGVGSSAFKSNGFK